MEDFLTELHNITNNINTPYIVCGDINAHHLMWETRLNQPDNKGQMFYDFVTRKNLVILNDGTHTLPPRRHGDNYTTPDITLATPNLSLHTTWKTTPDPLSSDHLPIHINIGHTTTPLNPAQRYNLKKANWYDYRQDIESTTLQNPTAPQITELIKQTATQHVPLTKTQHKHPKATPW